MKRLLPAALLVMLCVTAFFGFGCRQQNPRLPPALQY
jgi:hypothetical protein